jgi:hypothetical protein
MPSTVADREKVVRRILTSFREDQGSCAYRLGAGYRLIVRAILSADQRARVAVPNVRQRRTICVTCTEDMAG